MDSKTIETIATIAAIVIGPIVAVRISLWYQRRTQKYDAKNNLFMKLMAQRRTFPPPYDVLNSLNVIDVVFSEHPKVVQFWHEYYNLLSSPPIDAAAASGKFVDLLVEMGKALDYSNLVREDIDKFYSPQIHGDLLNLDLGVRQEFLRVLQKTSHFVVATRTNEAPQEGQAAPDAVPPPQNEETKPQY